MKIGRVKGEFAHKRRWKPCLLRGKMSLLFLPTHVLAETCDVGYVMATVP